MTDYFIGVDHKTPGWLNKVTFLGVTEIAVRSSIKSMFGIMGFNISDDILGLWFSSFILCFVIFCRTS